MIDMVKLAEDICMGPLRQISAHERYTRQAMDEARRECDNNLAQMVGYLAATVATVREENDRLKSKKESL